MEEKSHIISDILQIRLNPATYSGEKNAYFLVALLRIQRETLYYESDNKISSIVYLKYFTYFASCL